MPLIAQLSDPHVVAPGQRLAGQGAAMPIEEAKKIGAVVAPLSPLYSGRELEVALLARQQLVVVA